METAVAPTTVCNLQFLIPFPSKGAHTCTSSITHTHAQKAAGLLLQCPPPPSGPAVRWHPSPWRQLIASPDGKRAVKAAISPAFHLRTPAVAIAASSFVLHTRFCPGPSSFHVAITPFLFIKNAKSEARGGKKKTLLFYMELRLSVTPQSTAILPRPSH